VFENSETKKIFQHKRQELSVDCRILPNEELCDLYFLPIRWAGHVARTMEKRNTNKVLMGGLSSITLARVRISCGCWNRGTEHSGFIMCGEFF